MIIEEEAYLAHHGVRGMKWGRRNAKKRLTPADHKRRKKRVDTVHKTLKVAAGTAFVAALLAGFGGGKSSNKTSGSTSVEPFLKVIKPNLKKNASKLKPAVKLSGEALRMEEKRRNGAYHIQKMLKNMGEHAL